MTPQILSTLAVNSVVFSLLFLLALLIRKTLKSKLSSFLQYALCLMALFKLALPFGFESTLSPLGWFASAPAAQEQTAPKAPANMKHQNAQVDNTGDAEPAVLPSGPLAQNAAQAASRPSTTADATEQPASPKLILPGRSPAQWLFVLWLCGVLAVALWTFFGLCALHRRVQHTSLRVPSQLQSVFEDCLHDLDVRQRVRLVVQGAVKTPSVLGVFHPTILLPDHAASMDAAQLRLVLLHELTHIQRRDGLMIRLFNILSILDWFNPLLYICIRVLRADMETLCDQRVLGILNNESRQRYAVTVLQFAGKENRAPLFRAALGLSEGGAAMERRIRNMFTRKKTPRAMKAAAIIVACAMLAVCALTACQPTPEAPIVKSKNDGAMQAVIDAAPVATSDETGADDSLAASAMNSILAPPMKVQQHAQDTLTGTIDIKNSGSEPVDITVNVDADVLIPDVKSIPVQRVQPREIDEAFVQRCVDTILKDAEYVANNNYHTKSAIQVYIDEYQVQLNKLKAGELPPDDDRSAEAQIKEIEGYIADCKEQQKTAPDAPFKGFPKDVVEDIISALEDEKFSLQAELDKLDPNAEVTSADQDPVYYEAEIEWRQRQIDEYQNVLDAPDTSDAPLDLTLQQDITSDYYSYVSLIAKMPNYVMPSTLSFSNETYGDVQQGSMTFYLGGEYTGKPLDQDEARAKAVAMLADMGIDGVAVTREFTTGMTNEFWFSRAYNGISLNDVSAATVSQYDGDLYSSGNYSYPLQDERIFVRLNDTGLLEFRWDCPFMAAETENENVAAIPYEEAYETFKQHIFYKPYMYTTGINITQVRLGYMVIPVQNDIQEYRIIPVWDFIGATADGFGGGSTGDQEGNERRTIDSYLTVNALDGSVVDRILGY